MSIDINKTYDMSDMTVLQTYMGGPYNVTTRGCIS